MTHNLAFNVTKRAKLKYLVVHYVLSSDRTTQCSFPLLDLMFNMTFNLLDLGFVGLKIGIILYYRNLGYYKTISRHEEFGITSIFNGPLEPFSN